MHIVDGITVCSSGNEYCAPFAFAVAGYIYIRLFSLGAMAVESCISYISYLRRKKEPFLICQFSKGFETALVFTRHTGLCYDFTDYCSNNETNMML